MYTTEHRQRVLSLVQSYLAGRSKAKIGERVWLVSEAPTRFNVTSGGHDIMWMNANKLYIGGVTPEILPHLAVFNMILEPLNIVCERLKPESLILKVTFPGGAHLLFNGTKAAIWVKVGD